MSEGWKCPVCGRGVAPTEKNCGHEGGVGTMPYVPTFVPNPNTAPAYPPHWRWQPTCGTATAPKNNTYWAWSLPQGSLTYGPDN